jgi:hypothetical protein
LLRECPVTVTDDQVAALRALLTDDMLLYRRLFDGLDRTAAKKGYTALVTAAFAEAVERRFGQSHNPADIAGFVADIRVRSDRLARGIDPDVAERTILTALGKGSVQGLDRKSVTIAQLVLLAGVVADEHLNGDRLDVFLASARKLADQIVG